VEINSINSLVTGTGLSSRAPQDPSRPVPPSPAGTTSVPGQPAPSAEHARAAGRSEEINPSVFSQPAKLEQAIQESVEKINEFIGPYVTSLQFSMEKELGKIVVKVLDTETKEVIKQFPSEDILSLARALSKVAGLFVRQEA
jgi:flagellar protein FlaG